MPTLSQAPMLIGAFGTLMRMSDIRIFFCPV